MRIQSTNFLLTLAIKHSTDTQTLSAYGSKFDLLPVEQQVVDKIKTINILTYMPNRVMLVLPIDSKIELISMSLAGIKISNNILPNLIEYKPDLSGVPKTSVSEHLDNPSTRSLIWDYSGCVLFDFFHPNPFAYHMFIGNQIRF